MAIGRITGPMLVRNLERQGVDLAVEGNLIYFNVTDRFVGINTDVPKYYLDVNGNVFAGNTLTVGYEGNALYTFPINTAPNIGSIIVAGNIFNTPHDVIWSNVLIIDQEKRFVGVDNDPEYKLDVAGNIFAGDGLIVGNSNVALYQLPNVTFSNVGSILVTGNVGTLDTFWSNVLTINHELRLVGVDNDPEYKLDVAGNIFAGDGLIVGNANIALYHLPNVAAPNVGSILIAGNISNSPHDTFWSNVIQIDQERRFVGIDKSPDYKLDIAGNLHVETDANIELKLWVGQLVTVGNLYTLPTTTPTKNSYLMARGGALSETVWVPGPDEIFLRRRRYCKVIENLPGYGQYEFVMHLGITNIVYEFTVSRPVKVEVFSTPSKDEPNPYTFIGTPDHLVDDGSVYLNDGSSYQSRQYSIFANLEDPPKNSFYVTVTSIDQHLASLPVIITMWYYPALLDNASSGIRMGLTFPTSTVEGGQFFFKIDTKQLYIFYDGTWTPV